MTSLLGSDATFGREFILKRVGARPSQRVGMRKGVHAVHFGVGRSVWISKSPDFIFAAAVCSPKDESAPSARQ